MNRFFINDDISTVSDESFLITGANLKHIRLSLRLKTGESVVLCDGNGTEYVCVLDKITDDTAVARVVDCMRSGAESACRTSLFFALPKGDKTELIIEKAVELGVYELCPFISARCISRPDAKSLEKKTARWQAIAESAAKQSGRGIIPKVNPTVSYNQALAAAKDFDACLFFYENAEGKTIEKRHTEYGRVALFTGAEGGFSEEEVASAASMENCEVLTLGKRILRCETAPLAALSVLAYLEDAK